MTLVAWDVYQLKKLIFKNPFKDNLLTNTVQFCLSVDQLSQVKEFNFTTIHEKVVSGSVTYNAPGHLRKSTEINIESMVEIEAI